jgi:hypothetical protein
LHLVDALRSGRLDVANTTRFVVASTLEEVVADGVRLGAVQGKVVLVGRRPGEPSRPTGPGAAEATVGRPVLRKLACWAEADQVPA